MLGRPLVVYQECWQGFLKFRCPPEALTWAEWRGKDGEVPEERKWHATITLLSTLAPEQLPDKGAVYASSSVSREGHGRQHSALKPWLGVSGAPTPGLRVGDNAAVQLELDQEPQRALH
jgi:hypothetical protein